MQLATAAQIADSVLSTCRQIGRTPLLLLLIWFVTLWWGERSIWNRSASACSWHLWENWPAHAEPHRVLLVADPQLVDPHTYPGRPWPLSSLTIWITDLYLRRSYNSLLYYLEPHSTLFLGDLFDGGREWATGPYSSPDSSLKSYGTSFWLREYNRFMTLFVANWHKHKLHEIPSSEGRRIIASLPGNHDLGFAGGIDSHVKGRFDAHFGPMNRIDILGNHSFVSLDTVSLSAMDQIDPETGSSGAGDGTGKSTKAMEIWKPTETFLENARDLRARAVRRRYNDLRTVSRQESREAIARVPSSLFPTILLSHVPLFRKEHVSCGPLRERGTSIPIRAGYQYQNVLTPLISADIVKHLDADQMTMIYSGDDHDYCEIEHGEFTGRIREITVKSTSMAMGVSRPGVQLASLWNPINLEGISKGTSDTSMPKGTVQNHLCLLPHQEGIFLRYAQLLLLTVIGLAIRAVRYNPDESLRVVNSSIRIEKEGPLLPVSRKITPPQSPALDPTQSNTSSTPSTAARSRNSARSNLGGYGNLPPSSRSASPAKVDMNPSTVSIGYTPSAEAQRRSRAMSNSYPLRVAQARSSLSQTFLQQAATKRQEFQRTLILVAMPALCFYFWLIWNG